MRKRTLTMMPLRSLVKLLALAGAFLLIAVYAAPLLACPFFFLAPVAALARRFWTRGGRRADFLALLLPLVLIAVGLGLACADWYARSGGRLRVAAVSAAACAVCLGADTGHGAGRARRRRQNDDWEEQWQYWERWERREQEARRWRRAREEWARSERQRREWARQGPDAADFPPFLSPEDMRAYALLGLAPGAKFAAVKRAYRKLIAQHHPDKVGHLGEAARRAAEEKSKELNAAYSYLAERFGK